MVAMGRDGMTQTRITSCLYEGRKLAVLVALGLLL